jgi:hypothetical protein
MTGITTDLPLGEVDLYNGEYLYAEETSDHFGCTDCMFHTTCTSGKTAPYKCTAEERDDGIPVIYKKLEDEDGV